MALQPVSDPQVDQNFRYLERLIKLVKPSVVTAGGQPDVKQVIFSRTWVGIGLEWIAHRLNVLVESTQGLSVSKSGIATKRKTGGGVLVDANGLYVDWTLAPSGSMDDILRFTFFVGK